MDSIITGTVSPPPSTISSSASCGLSNRAGHGNLAQTAFASFSACQIVPDWNRRPNAQWGDLPPCAKLNATNWGRYRRPDDQKTFKNVFGRSVRTAKKPWKMFSADPFGQLKNLQKCFRQIRRTAKKPTKMFSADPFGQQKKFKNRYRFKKNID